MKTCSMCNEEKQETHFRHVKGNRGGYRVKHCRPCESKKVMRWQESNDYQKKESYVFYQRAYNILRDRDVAGFDSAVDLKEYLLKLWKDQEGKCFYTGIEMVLKGFTSGALNVMTVDRIDPQKNYVRGNIALCCGIVNRMKQDLSLDELKKWTNRIYIHLGGVDPIKEE